jgi:CRP/FNR family cyclic AMP-dependent transcriptional regulator
VEGAEGEAATAAAPLRTEGDIDRAALVGSIPLFAGLDGDALRELAGVSRVTTFPPDSEMIEEGADFIADDDGLFLLVQGRAEVRKAAADGTDRLLAELGPGDFFGELSMLDGQPRSASVVAATECTCLILDSWDFFRVIRHRPEVAHAVLVGLAGRVRQMVETHQELL